MLKGMFRTPEEIRIRDELRTNPAFRWLLEKLRQERTAAVKEMMYADAPQLQSKQGFARCLNELLDEL